MLFTQLSFLRPRTYKSLHSGELYISFMWFYSATVSFSLLFILHRALMTNKHII